MKNLLRKEQFLRKAIPYLKVEYFENRSDQIIFDEIQKYVTKYNNFPTIDALGIAIGKRDNIFESDMKSVEEVITQIECDSVADDLDWLDKETEKFCQERALYNAIHESIEIMGDKSKKGKGKGAIPQLLTDALAISFDPNVGHDYIEDADDRYEYYHRTSKKYPFDLKMMNKITGGGLEPKTLNVIVAGPKVGKTLMMCHIAAAYLRQNFNVLYITMEMAEEKISQRIDANMLDTTIDNLNIMPKETYDRKIARMKEYIKGKLIIKEYPTAGASVNNFRALINELYLKKQFKPHIVIIDYINICTSSRIKIGSNGVNSYTLIKSICEELRGLAVEMKFPILSATQLTRSGATNSDPEMTDTSESWGLPQTVDELWAAITSEELQAAGQIAIKRLASRSVQIALFRRFLLGINYGKMTLSDVEEQDLQDGFHQQIVPPKIESSNLFNVDPETGEILN